MSHAPLTVLYEDNHLLAVDKPARLPTMGAAPARASLWTLARDYLKRKYAKPGNVYLGVVSRLDAPVTGVVLFARTSKAASRLAEQYRRGGVEKLYWAIVPGRPKPGQAKLQNWLRKDERARRVRVVRPRAPGAKLAELSYATIARLNGQSLLAIQLHTGRKHQIRVQLAHHGHAILGDRKYGSRSPFPQGIALHARRLAFQHPVGKVPVVLVAPLPSVWRRFGAKDE